MTWPDVIQAFIISLPATIAAVAAAIIALRNGRRVDEVSTSIDGRMQQLLSATAGEAAANATAVEKQRGLDEGSV